MRKARVVLLWAGVLACGSGAGAPADLDDVPTWTLGAPVVLSGAEGVPLTEVVGAVRIASGDVVVADGPSATVHFYSVDGRHLRHFGRRGDGPGEFGLLASLGVAAADTVWAHDFAHQRVTFIGPTGELLRTVALEPRLGSGQVVGVLPDGTIVVGEAWSSARVGSAREAGLNRERVAYVSYSPEGRLLDSIAHVPGREVVLSVEGGRGVMGPAPLGRVAVHALVGGRLVVGDQERSLLRVFSPDRGRADVIEWPSGDLTLPEDLIEAWREIRLRDVSDDDRPGVEREIAATPLPARRPAHGPILAGVSGDIWVADYALPGSAPAAWRVLGPEGERKAILVPPPAFQPWHVSSEEVLGVTTGPLGVPRVEIRRIVRVAAAGARGGDEPAPRPDRQPAQPPTRTRT